MKSKMSIGLLCLGLTIGFCGRFAHAQSVWHEPWLNWDFQNFTGVNAHDFDIVVESGAFTPNEWWTDLFDTITASHADYDGDGDTDTKIRFHSSTGVCVLPNEILHTGMYMLGAGNILDAYWTDQNGQKIGYSVAISYELTEIRPSEESKEVHMHLQMAPGYYEDSGHPDYPNQEAGWTEIRTFVNIPAAMLELADLNRDLDLDALAAFEVVPLDGVTMAPILPTDVIWGEPDSFFDVYLDTIPDEYASPAYESLLHAVVLNQGEVVGEFWNLNPQSPEHGTLALIAVALGVGSYLIRRRR